jgi:hypothetical protein
MKMGPDSIFISDYIPVNPPLLVELKATFKFGTVLTDSDTVLQCVGMEFYNQDGTDGYVFYSTGTTLLCDMF